MLVLRKRWVQPCHYCGVQFPQRSDVKSMAGSRLWCGMDHWQCQMQASIKSIENLSASINHDWVPTIGTNFYFEEYELGKEITACFGANNTSSLTSRLARLIRRFGKSLSKLFSCLGLIEKKKVEFSVSNSWGPNWK